MPKITLKLILAGAGGVGKTSLVKRYVIEQFVQAYQKTLGVELFTREIMIGDTKVVLNVHDLAGQERFAKFRRIYLKSAQLGLLVFDLTNSKSLVDLERNWMPDIGQLLTEQVSDKKTHFPVVLIGNKLDLCPKHRDVEAENIKKFQSTIARRYPLVKILEYIETSALNNTNVDIAFENLINGYLKFSSNN